MRSVKFSLLPSTKNSAGFTLIELMVVLAIIGILAAVTITNYAEYLRDAKASVVLSDFRAAINEARYTNAIKNSQPQQQMPTLHPIPGNDNIGISVTQNSTHDYIVKLYSTSKSAELSALPGMLASFTAQICGTQNSVNCQATVNSAGDVTYSAT